MVDPYEPPKEAYAPPKRRRRAGARHEKPHNGVLILVFGIVGFVVCQVFSIVAWIMGHISLKEIKAGRMDPSGRGLVMAGMILGIVSVALNVLVFGVAIAFGAFSSF